MAAPRRVSLQRCFYSTQPVLAWCLNHYFFDRKHYVWCSRVFHPYRLANPKSSNPYLLYADLLQPWVDKDNYDRTVTSLRLSLREGVMAHSSQLRPGQEERLKRVCESVDIAFFAPVVYRVDISEIDMGRGRVDQGSALTGSDEELIPDLQESEFDLLFADTVLHPAHLDDDVVKITSGDMQDDGVLDLLEQRCRT